MKKRLFSKAVLMMLPTLLTLSGALFAGANARYKKNQIIESTANVSQFGKQVKVRMAFRLIAYDNRGDLITLGQINDEQFYQDFFAKVDKGIFIQKENI